MKHLLIVNRSQFGYHTDSYVHALAWSSRAVVTYVCIDAGRARRDARNVNVIYVARSQNRVFRALNFFKETINRLKDCDVSIFYYFTGCSILKLFCRKPVILDIRTGSVSPNRLKRKIENFILRCEALKFSKVAIISQGLRRSLGLVGGHIFEVPLGANVMATALKNYDNPKLIYIGTLSYRKLENVLLGLRYFDRKVCGVGKSWSFDVVGDGYKGELAHLKLIAFDLGISNNIRFHGYKRHDEISELFERCNIGISYIPITPYFNHQPPTKTFEYIANGMICVGTSTEANKKLITADNGLLCSDDPQSVGEALVHAVDLLSTFDAVRSKRSISRFHWHVISDEYFEVIDEVA